MNLQCMAVFRKVPEGYIAFIEEWPEPIPKALPSKKRGRTCAKLSPW